jgi:hypothetical protein
MVGMLAMDDVGSFFEETNNSNCFKQFSQVPTDGAHHQFSGGFHV